jgi:hypothetical protein
MLKSVIDWLCKNVLALVRRFVLGIDEVAPTSKSLHAF